MKLSFIMKRLRNVEHSLLTSMSIYMGSNILYQAIPFLMLPILTRYLTPFDYGVVTMVQMLVVLGVPLVGLGVPSVISLQFVHMQRERLAKYVSTGLALVLLSTSLFGAGLFLFREFISELTGIPYTWLWVLPLICLAQVVISSLLTLLQMQNMPTAYGILRISQTTVEVGLSILLVVFLGLSWQGRVSALLVTAMLFATIGLQVLLRTKWLKKPDDASDVTQILSVGTPLVAYELGFIVVLIADRTLIAGMIGIEESGIYMVGVQLGMIISLINGSFTRAWIPWLYPRLKEGKSADKLKIVQYSYAYFLSLLACAVLASLVIDLAAPIILGEQFQRSVDVVIWIALAHAFVGMYKLVAQQLFFLRKTTSLLLVSISSACLNIVLNIVMIRLNGAVGAAQATMISYVFAFILTWVLSARAYKMPYLLNLGSSPNRAE